MGRKEHKFKLNIPLGKAIDKVNEKRKKVIELNNSKVKRVNSFNKK